MHRISALAVSLTFAISVSGAIINVPDDYATVQSAIDAATDGDEVVVAPGTWIGSVNMLGKAITLRSSGGADVTTLHTNNSFRVISCTNDETAATVIDGFTIHGHPGGGMYLEIASPTVRNCIFHDSWVGWTTTPAALEVIGGSPRFESCTFSENGTLMNPNLWRVVGLDGATAIFTDCLFRDNAVLRDVTSEVLHVASSDVVMQQCTFARTVDEVVGEGSELNVAIRIVDGSHVLISECHFFDNEVRHISVAGESELTVVSTDFENNGLDPDGVNPSRQPLLSADSGSQLSLTGCQFIGNISEGYPADASIIVSDSSSHFSLEACNFSENEGGSAVLVTGTPANTGPHIVDCCFESNRCVAIVTRAEITVSNCTFAGNGQHQGFAQPITMLVADDTVLIGCTFTDHVVRYGSAAAIRATAPLTAIDCQFVGNKALMNGGGAIQSNDRLTILDCVFIGNHGMAGGAIDFRGTEVYIANSRIIGNSAVVGGGISTSYGSPTIVNCLFEDNTASSMGGAFFGFSNADPEIINCTISGNRARSGATIYGYHSDSNANLINCVVWGNTNDGLINNVVWGDTNNGPLSGIDGPGLATVSYSNVEGGYRGAGNIDSDPMFVNAAAGNYHLVADSPSIDTGLTSALPADEADVDDDGDTIEDIPLDLDFLERVIDADGSGNARVDMGCYEYDPSFNGCAADIDGNGSVEFGDLLALLATWGTCEACPGDIDGDGEVGFGDLIILLAAWGQCPE